ncbi:MAG TPA: GNAT family N-acetyltransferase [Candidatus Angelobacter sp.]|nr:GNAT family N-acetyltransferase [Candidatus Angelobacter sp.]
MQTRQTARNRPPPGSVTPADLKQYISSFQASDGRIFTVRPIIQEDEQLMVDFHRQLSEGTVYRRYFAPLKLESRIAHERLLKRCLIDYHDEIALVAEWRDEQCAPHLAAVGRLVRTPTSNTAEVAFVVADAYQGRGLGGYLLQKVIEIARTEGLTGLEAEVLADNHEMIDLFRRTGFHFTLPDGGTVMARREL